MEEEYTRGSEVLHFGTNVTKRKMIAKMIVEMTAEMIAEMSV